MRRLSSVLPLLLAFIGLGLAYGIIVPPFENLDEPGHFEVIRYIADTGALPVHGTPAAQVYLYRQEASQPPLYYLLSAGLVRVLGLQADDALSYIRFKPRVSCGPGATMLYDNRAVFYHNPHREAFPWQGSLLVLHILRAWSTLLQTITVAGTYLLALQLFPRRRLVALLSATVVALNPQFLFSASGINNDNLVIPLTTIGLYLLLRAWQQGFSIWRSLLLGLIAGLAGMSKLSGWLFLPLAMAVMAYTLLCPHPSRRSLSQVVFYGMSMAISALVVSGWWFGRNWHLYGDPTALRPMLELVGVRTIPIFPLVEGGLLFLSFWGQIPCSFYPSAFYIPYVLLVCAGVAGWIKGYRNLTAHERWGSGVLLGWFLLVLVGWMRWDMMTYAAGGRLLFPALPAIAILIAVGICNIAPRQWPIQGTAIALAFLALGTVVGILPAFFAPPPLRSPDAVSPANPTDVAFGEAIRLLGYDLKIRPERQFLDVTLYWQAAGPITQDYNIALQLVSLVPGDNTLRWTYDSWPGHGNYPTTAWQPGNVIVDRYRFRLPDADFPTQGWDFHLAVYEEDTMTPLPVRTGGMPVGTRLVLSRLRWPGKPPSCPEDGRLASDIRFGNAIALTHAQVVPEPPDVRVILCWKSLNPLPQDEHVFVHLYDAEGRLLQAGDGPPMGGAFPTSLWQPGDTVMDVHILRDVTLGSGNRIAIGWYNLQSGERLPGIQDGKSVPDNAVVIWPSFP